MMSTIFDTTSAELAALADQGDDAMKGIEEEGIVSFLDIRASKAQLENIRGKLNAIVQSLAADAEGAAESDDDPEQGRYRLTLAYYPLDRPSPVPGARANPTPIDPRHDPTSRFVPRRIASVRDSVARRNRACAFAEKACPRAPAETAEWCTRGSGGWPGFELTTPPFTGPSEWSTHPPR